MPAPQAPSGTVEIVDLRSGEVEVRGPLTFATAKHARAAGRRLIEASGDSTLAISCAGVSESDSAGLAVLLEWLALAKRHGRTIRFTDLPAPIQAVAQLSNVEMLLNQGFTATSAAPLSE